VYQWKLADCSYHMEVLEEEREDGRSKLNYTHVIRPGVTQLENYGPFPLTIIHFSVSILLLFSFVWEKKKKKYRIQPLPGPIYSSLIWLDYALAPLLLL
jgi:hypothetical protein